jgi:hypothetical protein
VALASSEQIHIDALSMQFIRLQPESSFLRTGS